MKNQARNKFSLTKIYCNLFGHKLRVSKKITDHVQEYRCSHCGMEMTDTANGFLARLTPKFKETNAYIAQIHERRKRRLYAKAS